MKILVVNSGSSSLKFQLFDMSNESVLIKGVVQRIGLDDAFIDWKKDDKSAREPIECKNHKQAVETMFKYLTQGPTAVMKSLDELSAIGHRVVHGGEKFKSSVLINDEVIAEIDKCSQLAPLHNPPNLTGIKACIEATEGKVPQIAVFDTAFHANMPPHAFLYGLPYEFYTEKKIRRYGFHGTSHKYVYYRAAELLGLDPNNAKMITCHLGNGASIAAIKNGVSIDTSMGLTPLEGLIMGTRCGDIDPAITFYLMDNYGYTSKELNDIYNKKSGLLGLSGLSNDMRDITSEMIHNPRVKLAYDVYAYRIKKYIGQYIAVLDGVDAIVLTAGVGENTPELRWDLFQDMNFYGIKIDPEKNKIADKKEMLLSTPDSKIKVILVPTNEELMIAKESMEILANS